MVNPKLLSEARDFAGADWENMKPESRGAILSGYRLPNVYRSLTWWQLPPTVKKELAMTLLEKRTVQK